MTQNIPSSWTPGAISSVLSKYEQAHTSTKTLLQATEDDLVVQQCRLESLEDAAEQIQALAIRCQTSCQAKISNIVNRCLAEIDPDTKYTFRLVFEEKRNQTEARCVLADGAGNECNISSVGGGIRNIVAFGLRLACLMLYRPAPSKILILDEPFQYLSKEYRTPMLRLLESLCSDLGVQIVMVSHVQEHITPSANVIEIE